jgi:NAD dependent epimerase/dehydratase family enzyme
VDGLGPFSGHDQRPPPLHFGRRYRPVTGRDFSNAFGASLSRRSFMKVPEFTCKSGFGEMSAVLRASGRVLPGVAMAHGFKFHFEEIGPALAALF